MTMRHVLRPDGSVYATVELDRVKYWEVFTKFFNVRRKERRVVRLRFSNCPERVISFDAKAIPGMVAALQSLDLSP